jgi:hypothetical protein
VVLPEDAKPPYFGSIREKQTVPFEGAWSDPRCVPPEIGAVSDREIEILTTDHVLSTLSVLGYGLENERIKAGLERLIAFQEEDGRWSFTNPDMSYGFTQGALMTIKSLHEPLCVYSLHGH